MKQIYPEGVSPHFRKHRILPQLWVREHVCEERENKEYRRNGVLCHIDFLAKNVITNDVADRVLLYELDACEDTDCRKIDVTTPLLRCPVDRTAFVFG